MKMLPPPFAARTRRSAFLFSCLAAAACSSSSTSSPADADRRDAGNGKAADARAKDATDDSTSAADGAGEAGGHDGGASDAPEAPDDAGAPLLTSLRVKESGASSLTLIPAFTSSIHDYYVRCEAGTNALEVTMTASTGADSIVLQPTKSAAAPTQTLSVSVTDGAALVAAATHGKATSEYWVRCLPADFPVLEWQPHPSAGLAPPGYYLVGNTTASRERGAYAMVLDSNGVPVWYERGVGGVFNVDSLVPGVISYLSPGSHESYENHRLDPLATTYVTVDGASADEHELRALANGDYLVFTSPVVSGVDLTGLTLPTADGGTESFGPNSTIRGCQIQEVDAKGDVVWQWLATNHFDPAKDMTYLAPVAEYTGKTPIVEPFHCNSIDVDTNGNLLVSARHMDSVFYIERATGKVLWKLGGATYSTDGATYVPVADPFYRQHDARFGSTWKSTCGGRSGRGAISLFDDETSLTAPARGVVYDVNVGASGCEDAAAPGAAVLWQYQGTGPVAATGSFRVQADGSGVIGWGTTPGFIFTEANAAGKSLLDLHFTDGSSSYRAVKLPLSAFDLDVLHATAGKQAPVATDAGVADAGVADAGDDVHDGGTDAPPDAGTTGGGCHTVTGSGTSEQCTYATSSAPGFGCPVDGGMTGGSCPSSGLYGCCVHTITTDASTSLEAVCYYSETTGAPAASECGLEAYDGLPYDWQTAAP